MQNFKKHIFYYIALIGFVSFCTILTLRLSFDKYIQSSIVVLMAFFYVIWGIFHHFVNHNLTRKIVIEYILIGAIGMTIILFLIKVSI